MPSRISPATYPIAATATALAYDPEYEAQTRIANDETAPIVTDAGQAELFVEQHSSRRVIPFAAFTSPAEREAIRMRAADSLRPAPLKTARVEGERVKRKRSNVSAGAEEQHRFEFGSSEERVETPGSHVPADALVATPGVRVSAALTDAAVILGGLAVFLTIYFYFGRGLVGLSKHTLPFAAAALLTVPAFYKLLWAFAGKDSFGTQMAKLELVDFDGRKPCRGRRLLRTFGAFVSFLAAGLGMLWVAIDEDKLTWHDHISSTFPTFSGEN